MKLTKGQLAGLIKEEMKRKRLVRLDEVARRLNELYPGSNIGSFMKQGVAKMWEADNFFQKALSEAEDDTAYNAINQIHKALEQMTFSAHDKMESIVSGDLKGRDTTGRRAMPSTPPRSR